MRKYNLLFFSALLFLFACKWGNTPPGIIKPDKMIGILTAIHLIDGKLANNPSPDSVYIYGEGSYLAVFKSFKTDSNQFKKSLKYYTLHPEQMDLMYTQILKNLQDKSDSLAKPSPTPKSKNALPKK